MFGVTERREILPSLKANRSVFRLITDRIFSYGSLGVFSGMCKGFDRRLIAGRVLVLIQVPALRAGRQAHALHRSFQKLLARLPHKRGANRRLKSLKKNSQPD